MPLKKAQSFAREDVEAGLGDPARLASQAGRSARSLHADAASSRLRNDLQRSRSSYTTPNSSITNLPRLQTAQSHSSSTPAAALTDSSVSPVDPFASPSARSSVISQDTHSSGDGQSSGSSRTKTTGNLLAAPSPGERLPTRRPGLGLFQQNSPYKTATPPMSVRDLGSDYTRYFNPFSDSRRSSWVSLGGAATPIGARSTTNLMATATAATTAANATGTKASATASTTQLPTDASAEKSFIPWMDDRLAAPFNEKGGYKFPMFLDEKEDDDDLHMPMPDDDVKLKPQWRDHFSRDNIVSTIGMFMMLAGLLFIFIVIPVLSFKGVWKIASYQSPLSPLENIEAWALVNNRTYPMLKNIRTSLIDPDTPDSAMKRKDIHGKDLVLVFSDEFNDNNRTFYPGDDPYFYAPDFWYGATMDLEWYDPDAVTTYDGTLELRFDKFPNHGVNYRSGMLHSWNQLCFKGGIFEVSISLPGPGGVMGFWPGAWAMGNLGRPGYMATTDGLWPYTYNECDAGITPNQSMSDGTSRLPGQRLNSCTCPGEDHPNPGVGRGAPEIDILEGSANGRGLGVITQSFQVAPFDIFYYADMDYIEYPDYGISFPNTWTGGPFQQAVSATSNLNNDWYDGKAYQKYAFEYVPGQGDDSYIAWFVGDDMTFKMMADAVRPNGNIGQRIVAEEPLSLILNFGMSPNWAWMLELDKLNFPATMKVDYIRWYQPKDNQMVTCDPPGFETTEYIANHPEAYNNPNKTLWSQTSYDWPKNKLMNKDVC